MKFEIEWLDKSKNEIAEIELETLEDIVSLVETQGDLLFVKDEDGSVRVLVYGAFEEDEDDEEMEHTKEVEQ